MTRIGPVRRLLMDAKALISKPECWCQEAYALSAKNRLVDPHSPRARKFCISGAIRRAQVGYGTIHGARKILAGLVETNILGFNDAPDTTHPMIMRLFNKAIRLAKEQGI